MDAYLIVIVVGISIFVKIKNNMKLYSLIPSLAVTAVICCSAGPYDVLTKHDEEINKIIAQMTLEEKVEMLHSKTNMSSEGVPRFNIQDIKYCDGPFGIREEGVPNGFQSAGWTLDSATYFPTGSALAATWSQELAYKYGTGMGREARLRGKDVILGPAINIQRLPVGGRSYEYLSEDPILSAALAVGYVEGVQDAGTAACIKHFAVNNQETNRGSVNAVVDERVLREIYLKPFQDAVEKAGAMSVMPAYNKVNGTYCSENNHLNNEILRGEWGFKGFTVSDWGGTHSTMGAALGGLNVQMTGSTYLGPALIDSVKVGKVPESVVDDKVREILRVRFAIEAIPADKCNIEMTSQKPQQEIAYEVAKRSVVLLQNDGILPAKKSAKIAVIGLNAKASTAAGGMGAGVKTLYEVTPFDGISNHATGKVTYAPAYKNYMGMFGRMMGANNPNVATAIDEAPDAALLDEALKLAKEADIVFFFCGTNKSIESEGSDRQNIDLPVGQNQIIEALAKVNPNIVSVNISGGPCDLRTVAANSRAVVQGWWNGLEGGNALADVLFGDIAPSGKLPITFPKVLEDSPAYALGNFPQKDEVQGDLFGNQYRQDVQGQNRFRQQRKAPDALYTEGALVGYRWFDTKQIAPLYAFGHGLSYVKFTYSNIAAKAGKDGVTVTFTLKNEGKMDAEEVAQLYIHREGSKVEWPAKELKAFQRVSLKAGESQTVTLTIPTEDFRYWDETANAWADEHCKIQLLLGTASDDIRLKADTAI